MPAKLLSEHSKPWYMRASQRWAHLRAVPMRRLAVLFTGVFFLFSVLGFYVDLAEFGGTMPYAVAVITAVSTGLNAVLWLAVLARLPWLFIIAVVVLQFFYGTINRLLLNEVTRVFHLQPVAASSGVHFASTCILFSVMTSYMCFIAYIRRQGRENFRIQNELALAHGIQKTLVPPIALRTACFEIYGISCPSEKVGGDLVDAVLLPGGDAIAYLADIAGHGLQAGILMGMLKTAARTALLDAGERPPDRTLPVLLDRLNTVLPEVKEAHMYATFTGFRLGADGSVFYALAASPPLLHWHASGAGMSNTEVAQFPLGLLPVDGFEGSALQMAPGDLLVVATDGILEVTGKQADGRRVFGKPADSVAADSGLAEYGTERLKDVIAAHAGEALPALAGEILASARAFGRQFDDQTILLVRRV